MPPESMCASELFVAVPADRDPEPVRSYLTFTKDLHELELVDSLAGFWSISSGMALLGSYMVLGVVCI
jgi:hypothetical protein